MVSVIVHVSDGSEPWVTIVNSWEDGERIFKEQCADANDSSGETVTWVYKEDISDRDGNGTFYSQTFVSGIDMFESMFDQSIEDYEKEIEDREEERNKAKTKGTSRSKFSDEEKGDSDLGEEEDNDTQLNRLDSSDTESRTFRRKHGSRRCRFTGQNGRCKRKAGEEKYRCWQHVDEPTNSKI